MTEIGANTENTSPIKIEFEPGIHPTKQEEYEALIKAVDAGDLTAHVWNPEVGHRIKARAFDKPSVVVAIDGLSPKPNTDLGSMWYNDSSINYVTWAGLPARPSELNQSGSVYVLRGDPDDNLVPGITRNGASLPEGKTDPDYKSNYIESSNNSYQTSRKTETILRPAVFLASMFSAGEIRKRLFPNFRINNQNEKYSRRDFLKIMGLFGAAIVLAVSPDIGYSAMEAASKSTTDEFKRIMQKIDQLASPKLFTENWIDARTGILYSKMEDVFKSGIRFRPGTDFSIVMGDGHNKNQDAMANNIHERNRRILKYGQQIKEFGIEAYAIYRDIPASKVPPEPINRLLSFLASAEVLKVTDPGVKSDKKPDFLANLMSYFSPVITYQSPKVEDAIKSLRPS